MEEARSPCLRDVPGEPARDGLHLADLARLRVAVAPGPAGNLPRRVAVGVAEAAQAGRRVVEPVQRRQRLDERGAQGRDRRRREREALGQVAPQDHAPHALHEVEPRAQDCLVLAEAHHPRDLGEDGRERGQHLELAAHVVGGLHRRAEGRAPENQLASPRAHEVGQVRVAARELPHAQRVPVRRNLPAVRTWQPVQAHQVAHDGAWTDAGQQLGIFF